MNKDEELCEKKCQEAVDAAIDILKDIDVRKDESFASNVKTILSAYAKIQEITKGEYVESMHILCSAYVSKTDKHYTYGDEIHPYCLGGLELVILLKAAMVLNATDNLDSEISYIQDDYLVNFRLNKEVIDVVSKNIT